MTTKILKSTERGQITLPVEWRTQFTTGNFIAELHDEKLILKPLVVDESEVLFDADRDNDGKGISAERMIALLKDIQNG